MKPTETKSSKKIKLEETAESLQNLEKSQLIDKILKLSAQLAKANQSIKAAERREGFIKVKLVNKEKELANLLDERNHAYWSGIGESPCQKEQLLDPFIYEAVLGMKEQWHRRNQEYSAILEDNRLLKAAVSTSKDEQSEALSKALKEKQTALVRVDGLKVEQRRIGVLEKNLAVAVRAVQGIRKERKDRKLEISERDIKIARLEEEIQHLKNPTSPHENGIDEVDEAELLSFGDEEEAEALDLANGMEEAVVAAIHSTTPNTPEENDDELVEEIEETEVPRGDGPDIIRTVEVNDNGNIRVTL